MDRQQVLDKITRLDTEDMVLYGKNRLDIMMAVLTHTITVIPIGVRGIRDEDIDEERARQIIQGHLSVLEEVYR